MKTMLMAEVIKNQSVSEGIFEIIISAPEIAEKAVAGQFIDLYTGMSELLLPRPISICEIDKKQGTLRLIYQVVGRGTEIFSKLNVHDTVKVIGPLGNGFSVDKNIKNNVVIGGGIGAPPLLQLVKELNGNVNVFLGSRSKSILANEFKSLGANVYIATDDGSEGFHGNVLELIKSINPKAEAIYACGPKIMLKFTAEWANDIDVVAQVSMEERMACGIGACVGCAVKINKNNGKGIENLKVCKDGPVFLSNEVVWNE